MQSIKKTKTVWVCLREGRGDEAKCAEKMERTKLGEEVKGLVLVTAAYLRRLPRGRYVQDKLI